MISANGRVVRCRMSTGDELWGIWTRINRAPRKQVVVTAVDMAGVPNEIEVKADNGRWIDFTIASVVAADPHALAEMQEQGDVPLAQDMKALSEERADVWGASYVSVPVDAGA